MCSRATSIVPRTAGSPTTRSENARIASATASPDELLLADRVLRLCAYAIDVALQLVLMVLVSRFIEEARLGYARLSMRLRDDMLNGHGIAHGGMVFALADTAFA